MTQALSGMLAERPRAAAALRDLAAVGVLALACALLFRDAVTLRGVLFYYDHSLQNFPYRQFFAEGLRQGDLRLWTDDIFCGFPLFAEGQGNPLYPLFPLLFVLLPDWVAYNFYTVVHFLLAGWFAYVLARVMGLRRDSAVLVGLCYMCTGPLVAHAHHTNIVVGIAYLPLLLALVEMTFRRGKSWPIILFALATACLILGAQPQYVLYDALACGLFLLWRLSLSPANATGRGVARRKLFTGAALAGATLIALGLAAVQMLPLMELVSHSSRGVVSAPLGVETSTPPAQLITLLLPHYFGVPALESYWGQGWIAAASELTLYVGIFPLLMVPVAVLTSRRRDTLFFAALAVFSFVFSLGITGTLYWPFAFLPVLRSTRFPARFAYVGALSLAMLAGIGLEGLGAPGDRKAKWRAALASVCLLLVLSFACLMVAAGFNARLAGLGTADLARLMPLDRAGIEVLRNHLHHTLPLDMRHLAAVSTACALVAIGLATGRLSRGLSAALAALVVFADLFFCARGIQSVTDPALFRQAPPIARLIAQRGRGRLFHYGLADAQAYRRHGWLHPFSQGTAIAPERFRNCLDGLPLNSNMLWDVDCVNGFSPLQTLGLKRLLGKPSDTATVIAYELSAPVNLLGARYILTQRDLGDRYRSLARIGPLRLYENPDALPRAFIVHHGEVCSDEAEAVERLRSPSFDYGRCVLLHGVRDALESPGAQLADADEVATVLPDTGGSDDTVLVAAHLNRPGYLVLVDQFYPGWRVEVDGEPAELIPADYIFRAVRLPAGSHTVRFAFRPGSVRLGAALAIAPLSAEPCAPRRLRLVRVFALAAIGLSPLCRPVSWLNIPWELSPRSYVAKRAGALSYAATTMDRHEEALRHRLIAYRWGPRFTRSVGLLATKCERAAEELVAAGRPERAAQLMRECLDAAPEIREEESFARALKRLDAAFGAGQPGQRDRSPRDPGEQPARR